LVLLAADPWPAASASAYPPPMQNPISPTLPAQSPRADSQSRAASMSATVRPVPAVTSRMTVHRQRSLLPQ
jgi:hypothetical protein